MMTDATDPDRRKHLEAKLIEHLESAQAITGYLVERALDDARALHWPHIDPNVDAFQLPPKLLRWQVAN